MTAEELKKQIRLIRAKGKTYTEIKKILGVDIPKSTLSSWCCGIRLPEWYNEKIRRLNNKGLIEAQKIAWAKNQKK